MKVAILSDIHGNISALQDVFEDQKSSSVDGLILLGDIIDYGQHSNEVIDYLEKQDINIICNIWGNHEDAICNDRYERFSSPRGVVCAKHTKDLLNEKSWDYLNNKMIPSGMKEFELDGKKVLAIHGSVEDEYWKAIKIDSDFELYKNYDIVLSGHSHIPHYFEQYYDADNPQTRNKKKTIFINPGSVGQPRNHNNKAQYVIYDTDTEDCDFRKVKYDIAFEQNSFDGSVDEFYKDRLGFGV